ncbi:MAG: hypothetical protein N3D11_05410 [Candidatus Sumerlaeia bacterium]|nr:hypothetical protein [Candidatus Sumerlaeia bacterium]
MRRFFAFFRYELWMHVKSWRLWLCAALLMAAAVPWAVLLAPDPSREKLDDLISGYLEKTIWLWRLFVPIVIIVAVDSISRVRATGIHPILFTKPFSTFSYLLGCWAAVAAVTAFLAAATLTTRFVVGRIYFDPLLCPQPFIWLWALGAAPLAMGLAALVVWVRVVFKHNILAYGAAILLAGLLYHYTGKLGWPFLGWSERLIEPLQQPYIPEIGRDLSAPLYVSGFLNTLALCLAFLVLAGYHFRRREPQRSVAGKIHRWTDMPTFRRFFTDLLPDRQAGPSVHLALVVALAFAAALAGRAAWEHRTRSGQEQRWARELREELRHNGPVAAGLPIRHIAGSLNVSRSGRIACDLRVEVANTTRTAVSCVVFSLPFGMEIERVESAGGEPLRLRQWANLAAVDFLSSLTVESTTSVRLVYSGHPMQVRIGDRPTSAGLYDVRSEPFEDLGGRRFVRVGASALPRTVALTRGKRGVDFSQAPRSFTCAIELAPIAGLEWVSPDGTVVADRRADGTSVPVFRSSWARSDFTLWAGPYEMIERQFGALPLRVYCFRSHRDTLEFALRELSETLERWGQILGPPRGSQVTLLEAPFGVRSEERGLPSGTLAWSDLTRLQRFRPAFDQRKYEGIAALDVYQTRLSSALAARILRESLRFERSIGPLREALYSYLISTYQRSEIGPLARRSRSLFQTRTSRSERSLLDPARRALFDTPLVARMAMPAFEPLQAVHIWRMLHYLLEDDKFAAFLRALIAEFADRTVREADLRQLAERFYGAPLDWFFDHWLHGKGTPRYVVTSAYARMVENKRTRDIEYDVTFVVANQGQGKMPVPVLLQTERDRITRPIWLDSGTSQTVTLHVPDRPEAVYVDPQNWITQEMTVQAETRSRGPAWRRVLVLE